MTTESIKSARVRSAQRKKETGAAALAALFLVGAGCAALFLSGRLAEGVREGLRFSAEVIAPALFPSMLFSDLLISFCDFEKLPFLPRRFSRFFGVSPIGIAPFLIGLICGFPLGVKCAVDLYRSGAIRKKEAERLIGFCNNTGPAFLIAGIGIGLRGSASDGFLLFSAVFLSALAVGRIGREKQDYFSDNVFIQRQKYSFVRSVRSAGENLIGVFSFVTVFSVIADLLGDLLGTRFSFLLIPLLPLLEVGNAAKFLAQSEALPPLLSLSLTGFAVGFSGLSVHAQAMFFLAGTDLSTRGYYKRKFLQGAFAAGISFALFSLRALLLPASAG